MPTEKEEQNQSRDCGPGRDAKGGTRGVKLSTQKGERLEICADQFTDGNIEVPNGKRSSGKSEGNVGREDGKTQRNRWASGTISKGEAFKGAGGGSQRRLFWGGPGTQKVKETAGRARADKKA